MRSEIIRRHRRDNEMLIQAVSVWVSWLLANSLCHGDLNMTGADTLWRHSRSHNKQRLNRGFSHGTGQLAKPDFTRYYLFRKLTDEIHKYETRLGKLELDMDEQEMRRKSLEETLTKAQDVHDKNKRKFKLLQSSGLIINIRH